MNRKGMPPAIIFNDKCLKNQVQMTVVQEDLCAAKWPDKRIVTFLTTADSSTDQQAVHRKKKDGSSHSVQAHAVVGLYNTNMNGVDHSDQL